MCYCIIRLDCIHGNELRRYVKYRDMVAMGKRKQVPIFVCFYGLVNKQKETHKRVSPIYSDHVKLQQNELVHTKHQLVPTNWKICSIIQTLTCLKIKKSTLDFPNWLRRLDKYTGLILGLPSQWETALLCNDVSLWLGANLESALIQIGLDI